MGRHAPQPGPSLQAAILRLLPPAHTFLLPPAHSFPSSATKKRRADANGAGGGEEGGDEEGGGSCEVALPARLVVAGGWSDTAPMCVMRPGAVFNMACALDGHKPLQASAFVTPHPPDGQGRLELVSKDQMLSQEFESWDHLYRELLTVGGERGGGGGREAQCGAPMARSMDHECSLAVHAACVAAMFDK